MNIRDYSYEIEDQGKKTIFKLISSTGGCVGKIVFTKEKGRMANIYKTPHLGTANGGKGLEDIGLTGIEEIKEKIPGLLYIMFTLFIKYIRTLESDTFLINIEKPLLTLEDVYRRLYRSLLAGAHIELGVIRKDIIIFRCE